MSSLLPGTALSESEQAALVYTLSDCFAQRPTLESVAPGLVRDMLEDQYPLLGERLAQAAFIHPVPDPGKSDGVEYGILPLANLLIERFLGEKALVHPADSYLTLYPGAEHPQQLSLALATTETLLDEWAPLLLQAYKQALVDFWSSPLGAGVAPWQRLSDFIAAQLRQAGAALTGDERDTVQALLDYPDPHARRAALGNDCTQVSIPISDIGVSGHFLTLVMSRWVGKREIVLRYTLFGGIEAFDSSAAQLDGLSAAWGGKVLRISNYLPDAHAFDALAVSLLMLQLEAIASLKPGDYRDPTALEHRLLELSGLQAVFGAFRSGHEAKLGQLRDLLPKWLRNASSSSRTLYGRYVAALASLYRGHAGKTFLDGIPDILTFAGESLQRSLRKKHPEAATLSASDISVTLTAIVSSAVIMGDGVMPVGFSDKPQTHDYVDLALKNLKAFPLSNDAQVHYQGQTAPAWMTYEALRAAVSDADIGQAYPEELKQNLQRDQVERARQQQLFTDYLRVLLPMVALELQLTRQLTETARLYVEAVVTQDVGVHEVLGQRIVARPLAFLTHSDASADRVCNMFVLGPRAPGQGPQVLCCPGADRPLREFPSLDGVLSAIKEAGPLQQSVLNGLDSARRSIYENGGFEEPHLGRVIVSDWDIPASPDPVSLDTTELSGSFGAALFAATVEVLIARAEMDSVSNAEERWNRFSDLGWALFNLSLPLTPAPLIGVGLLVQLASSLKTFSDPNASPPWVAFADVLLNLAVVLVYHREPPRVEGRATGGVTGSPTLIDNAVYKEPAASVPSQLVVASTPLGGGLSVSRLARLEEFKRPKLDPPGTLLASGEWQGLYQRDELFYACIDDAWFRVSRKLEGVVIVDDRLPSLQGPWIRRDGAGGWQLDRGLRLLGGAGELSVRAAKKLKSLEKKARDLLANLPAVLADADRSAGVVKFPRDIQDLLRIKSQPFAELLEVLSEFTRGLSKSPRSLIAELEQAIATLAERGLSLRIELSKKGLPTVSAVEFLKEQKQVIIRKLGDRRDISQGKGADFFEEYEIRGRGGVPTWYAHFHYPAATTPAKAFSAAHLKTFAQRSKGLNFQIAQATENAKVDPIWRGKIDIKSAEALFLAPNS